MLHVQYSLPEDEHKRSKHVDDKQNGIETLI